MKTPQSKTSESTATRAASGYRAKNAIEVLTDDHRAVKRLFDAFRKADEADLDRKGTLVRRACEELTIHTIVEEKLLYPAAQRELDEEDRPDVEEAYVEHFLVKVLIDKFATLKPADKGFDATFKVLMEMVEHHIDEEESELFPALKKTGADLEALGTEILKQKTSLESKLPKDAGDRTMQLH